MANYFKNFPKVDYDVEKDGTTEFVMNPLLRFRLKEILVNKTTAYYTHNITDGQHAQFIAERYYGNSNLEWLIYITNDIIDPLYEWPLEYQNLINYIKSKYGSIEIAQTGVHHYEEIIQTQSIRYTGKVIPRKVLKVDLTTYNSLSTDSRRLVSNYTYEMELNEAKRLIKILRVDYLQTFLKSAENIIKNG
jgi:hypothetical protein